MLTSARVREDHDAAHGSYVTGDLDALAKDPWQSGLTYSLLGNGPVRAEAKVVDFNDVALRTQSADRSLSCRGRVGNGVGFLELWPEHAHKIAVNGRTMTAGQGFLSVGDDPVELTSVGPADSVILAFKVAQIRGALSSRALDLLSGDPARRGLIDLDRERGRSRGLFARSIMQRAATRPEATYGESVFRLIVDLIEDSARANSSIHASVLSASRIVQRAVDIMHANVSEPLDLKDIAGTCGVSQRTLIYQFNDIVGITPMAYYKLQRLNAVRRGLKAADVRITRVIDVAAEFGFYHMGHFAADFRELFGVLPSEIIGTERKQGNCIRIV